MRQIISGLAFLHGKHIAHRDLKPERVGFWCLFWVLSCAGFCAVGLWCLECLFFDIVFLKFLIEGMSKNPFRIQISTSTSIGSPDGDCHQQYEGVLYTPQKMTEAPQSVLFFLGQEKTGSSPSQMVTSTRWRYETHGVPFPPKMWIESTTFRRTFWSPRWGKQILPTRTDGHDGWDLPRMQTKLGMWCTTRKRPESDYNDKTWLQ